MNKFRVARILLNLLAQTANMNIDRTYIARILVSPDNIQKILAAVHLIGIEYKQLENIEFLGCEIDLLVVDVDPAALAIHAQPGHLYRPCLLLLIGAFL